MHKAYKNGCDKKGLSTIVATLLIILLTLVAVGIIWVVVRNVLQSGSEQVSLGKFTLSLEIKSVMRDMTENSMDIKIKRNAGEGQISGLAFIAEGEGNTEIVKINNLSFKQLEERTFSVSLTNSTNVSKLEKVSIAPIFRLESGKDVVGDVADVYIFSESFEANEIICNDTCSSLGYACGNQNICGVNTNCGGCSDGNICNAGTCAPCQGAGCIASCEVLSTAGMTYTLTSNVTSGGTCFIISAQNIILDCQNRWITYSTAGTGGKYGIYTNQFNTTIKNCNVLDGNWTSLASYRFAIYLYNAHNSTLFNNFITGNRSFPIVLSSTNFSKLTSNIANVDTLPGISIPAISLEVGSNNNNLINNMATSNIGQGIYITSSSNNILTNNLGISNISHGIELAYSSYNNILTNNRGTSNAGMGIYIQSSSNNTLTNNIFVTNGTSPAAFGIYLYSSSNNNLMNNAATSNQAAAIRISTSSDNNTLINNAGIGGSGISFAQSSNNILTNNTAIAGGSGIYISLSSNNNTFTNNIATSNTNSGVYIYSSSNNIFINQIAKGLLGGSSAVRITGSNNTMFRDSINISGYYADVLFDSGYISINNTFINCPYALNKEGVNGAGNELIRKWYYKTYVNSSSGAVQGASVSAYNNLNVQQFTELTDSSGWIERQEVIDYVNTGGIRNYYNNYIINASKTGYATGTKNYNFTVQQNKINEFFTLS